MWRIGKRELIAMVAGSLAYALLLYAAFSWAASLDPSAGGGAGFWLLFYGINSFSALAAIISGTTFALPFFVGAEFGPWAGLGCALVGRFLGERLLTLSPLFAHTLPTPWFAQHKELYVLVYIAWTLFGFIPGLVSFARKKIGTFAIVAVMASAFSILVVDYLLYFVERNYPESNHYGPLSSFWSLSGSSVAFSSLSGLVVLAVLLVLAENWPALRKKFRSMRTA